ncbi:MAG TPA: hypothetical protein VFB06_33910 [Streptosporangiaceae bacterium]|nr:hypothetical protein [Streptosporangiaceae bacterium]
MELGIQQRADVSRARETLKESKNTVHGSHAAVLTIWAKLELSCERLLDVVDELTDGTRTEPGPRDLLAIAQGQVAELARTIAGIEAAGVQAWKGQARA